MSSARAHASCGDNLQDNSIQIELLTNGAAEGRREVARTLWFSAKSCKSNYRINLVEVESRKTAATVPEHNSLISLHEIRIMEFL